MALGKNFSANNLGQRKKSDFYETPYSMTKSLLEILNLDRGISILEPACGDLAIVKVLKENGYENLTYYDAETDFLKEQSRFDFIITNPPFSIAHEFIERAIKVCNLGFAFLLPLSYLHGQKRYLDFYKNNNCGLRSVNVFTRYPMLGEPLRPDGKYTTGMMVYAWFVFSKGYREPPTINWIDNNHNILSKKDWA